MGDDDLVRTIEPVCFMALESFELTPRIRTQRQSLLRVWADADGGPEARLKRKGSGVGEIGAGRAFRAT
jgi:hypothetical protein